MAPHGEELPPRTRARIVSLHKDGKGRTKIGRLLKPGSNTVKAVKRRYKRTKTIENKPRCG